jgi:hypothetical protein
VSEVIVSADALVRRRRSALLSAIAALITTALFGVSLVLYQATTPFKVWILVIGLPPIILSVAAALQYSRTPYTGAGAAATAVYWVLVITLFVSAGVAYMPGAVLQTVAWYLSRPGRR